MECTCVETLDIKSQKKRSWKIRGALPKHTPHRHYWISHQPKFLSWLVVSFLKTPEVLSGFGSLQTLRQGVFKKSRKEKIK
jgi:hypothetical protein